MTSVAVIYLTDHGQTVVSVQQPGASPGALGGFDVQKAGENWFCAILNGVARGTTLNGAGTLWYSITGGSAQAICIIVPYYTWSGGLNTSNTHPDIIVALTALDGSSRSLLWIEGGATPGTIHNLTPVAGMVFDNPNCITVSYQHHIAVFGKVSGIYHLYTTYNQGGAWHDRGTLSSPSFLRDRRNDNRAAASASLKGQLYIASNSELGYSSKWASGAGSIAGLFPRVPPFVPTGLDTVY